MTGNTVVVQFLIDKKANVNVEDTVREVCTRFLLAQLATIYSIFIFIFVSGSHRLLDLLLLLC